MTSLPSHPGILLGLVCPALYLKLCRRWIGAIRVGLVWVPSAALAGLGFLLTFTTGIWGLPWLFVGLLLVLLSALTAWLWAWWAPVGMLAWGGSAPDAGGRRQVHLLHADPRTVRPPAYA